MGVPGGMNGTTDALVAAVRDLPAETTSWSATGIGRSTLSVILASLSKGGHLRVGMEDVLTISRGVPVESNAQLVERAVAIGALAQRTPMTPDGGARADRRTPLSWPRWRGAQRWRRGVAALRLWPPLRLAAPLRALRAA